MKSYDEVKNTVEHIVAKLFDNNTTPMEHIGISWECVEMLERHHPEVVIKAPINDMKHVVGGC